MSYPPRVPLVEPRVLALRHSTSSNDEHPSNSSGVHLTKTRLCSSRRRPAENHTSTRDLDVDTMSDDASSGGTSVTFENDQDQRTNRRCRRSALRRRSRQRARAPALGVSNARKKREIFIEKNLSCHHTMKRRTTVSRAVLKNHTCLVEDQLACMNDERVMRFLNRNRLCLTSLVGVLITLIASVLVRGQRYSFDNSLSSLADNSVDSNGSGQHVDKIPMQQFEKHLQDTTSFTDLVESRFAHIEARLDSETNVMHTQLKTMNTSLESVHSGLLEMKAHLNDEMRSIQKQLAKKNVDLVTDVNSRVAQMESFVMKEQESVRANLQRLRSDAQDSIASQLAQRDQIMRIDKRRRSGVEADFDIIEGEVVDVGYSSRFFPNTRLNHIPSGYPRQRTRSAES